MKNFFSSLEIKRESIANWSVAMGSLIIFFLVSLLVTVATSFFLGLTIGRAQFIASLIMVLGLSFDLVNNIKIQGGGKNIGLKLFGWVCLLIVISIAIETPFYDISFDGQNYHQEGIIQLKEGWNPHITLLNSKVNPFTWMFTQHFAKGSWYIDASIYAITGFIQSAKASNILFIAASFLFVLVTLLKLTSLNLSIIVLFSFLFSFNPIWANQYLSFYVDGQVSSCILMLICSMCLLYKNYYNKYLLQLIIGSCILILSNLKFTGIIYSALFSASFCGLYILNKRYKEGIQHLIIFGIFGLIAILYVGFGTYVINTVKFGHPFYPIYGSENAFSQYFNVSIPITFIENNSIVSFIYSLFSVAGQIDTQAPAILKLPFSFSIEELKIFVREEPRTSGFGPWFSGSFILTLLALIIHIIFNKVKISKEILIIWAVLLCSVLIIPANWWARYVPQFYFLILSILLWIFVNKKPAQLDTFLKIIILSFCINTIVITGIYSYNNILKTVTINEQINSFKGKTIISDFSIFQATRMRFIEKGIPFEEAPKSLFNEKCAESAVDLKSAYSSVKICVKK